MLSQSENEFLTRVGPGTPVGTLMRQYWVPALLSSELPGKDCAPVRVLLLGEKLIAFRDSAGRPGLLANSCPHRGASLFFGRNEEGGLRCVYHGWKFDVAGTCLETPNEIANSRFRDHVRATAYPCAERGGVIYAYMGGERIPPEFPDLEVANLAEGEREVYAVHRACNWLQAIEGELDTSHLGFLHLGAARPEDFEPGSFAYYTVKDRAPRYEGTDTAYGAMYGAYRPADDGRVYWRIAQYLFPCYTQIPTGPLGEQVLTRAWVPMDDENSMFFSMGALPSFVPAVGREELQPNTSGWLGRFRPLSEEDNDYRIDRSLQRSASYTGIAGIHMQDKAITESMGRIFDRSGEHLCSSDAMVTRLRRRVAEAARALIEEGTTPPGVADPKCYRVRSGGVVLEPGADWLEATAPLVNY